MFGMLPDIWPLPAGRGVVLDPGSLRPSVACTDGAIVSTEAVQVATEWTGPALSWCGRNERRPWTGKDFAFRARVAFLFMCHLVLSLPAVM